MPEIPPYLRVHSCYQPRGAGFDPARDCPGCLWAEECQRKSKRKKVAAELVQAGIGVTSVRAKAMENQGFGV